MVLCSAKTCNIFFECFVASASSGHCQTLFSRLISCRLLPLFYLSEGQVCFANRVCFHGSTDQISDTSCGSDRCWGTESVWLVRLSQKFVNISKMQMQPSSNKHELMVQWSLIDKSKTINS